MPTPDSQRSSPFQLFKGIFTVSRFRNWLFYGSIIGLVTGIGAIVFTFGIDLLNNWVFGSLTDYVMPAAGKETGSVSAEIQPAAHWLFFVVPAVGGLIVGWLVFKYAPEAEGHGTDEVVRIFHRGEGIIRKRVPFIKTLASIITIGTGGSAGREGPVALIGAGFGSFLADLLKFPTKYRRLMVVAGMGGGIGSIFRAPLGGALFATEVLYREPDFEYEGLMPAIIAAIVGYSVYGVFYGWGATFDTPKFLYHEPYHLLLYLILGVIEAGFGLMYIRMLYATRDKVFRRIAIPRYYRPALGGLLLGVLAYYFPPILGSSYGWVQLAIVGKVALWAMILFPFLKIIATSLTIGSGGSGGVFAPSLAIGGMIGGAFGELCAMLLPGWQLQPAEFIMVGMAGFFAGIAKVPVSALILVAELTGSYGLLVPTMLVASVVLLLTRGESIYEAQVAHRAQSPAHRGEFLTGILQTMKVKELMIPVDKRQLVTENYLVKDILKIFTETSLSFFFTLDGNKKIAGIITFEELRRVLLEPDAGSLLVARDLAVRKIPQITVDNTLSAALDMFTEYETDELAVISADKESALGLLRKQDLLHAYTEVIGKQTKKPKR